MTHNPEKLVSLDWNQFPLDHSLKDVVVKFDVSMTAHSLSLNLISQDQEYGHELILKLHVEGFSDREISDYPNEHIILTHTGLDYYPELVRITRKK